METLAPNTAAFDTPKVLGEAIMFPKTVCMMRPESDNPAPAIKAAKASGSRIFVTIRIALSVPTPNNAKNESPKDKELLPSIKQRKKPSRRSKERHERTKILFARIDKVCLSLDSAMGGL